MSRELSRGVLLIFGGFFIGEGDKEFLTTLAARPH